MVDQHRDLGLGRTEDADIKGYQLGTSRTGSKNAISAACWGSQVQFGRLVVYSPEYNQAVAAGLDNPDRSVMVPDATGAFLRDPSNGQLLSTNAALLAARLVNNGATDVYRVAGVAVEGDRCDDTRCDRPEAWPVGDFDNLYEWQFAQNRRPVTVQNRGYCRVRIGEDLNPGDKLAFIDAPDSLDTNTAVQSLGCFVAAGNGVQDLPDTWEVIAGGLAGGTAEIYMGTIPGLT